VAAVIVRGKRILVADDESGVREAIKLLLCVDAHTVTEAETGAAALELYQKQPFDLVITDYEMPRMRGDELAMRIRKLSPSQPIIMISAYMDQLENTNSPINAFLHKPFQFAELRRVMSKLLA
jgi:CheY-like chemotaxis protein